MSEKVEDWPPLKADALCLADELAGLNGSPLEAAAELRRLHAANLAHEERWAQFTAAHERMSRRIAELEGAGRLALEALEQLQGGCTDSGDGTVEAITVWCPEVIAALSKALEGK